MKVKLFDRILLALLLLATLLFSIAMILLAFGAFRLDDIQNCVNSVFTDQIYLIILGAVGFIGILVTLRLMFGGHSKKDKKEPMPSSTLIKASELGASFITLNAIDAMVQKHCRSNNHIRTTASTITAVKEGGVTISVRLALMPDTNIPELVGELQHSMKEYIEQYSGIMVREIGVLIEDTSINPKSRVD